MDTQPAEKLRLTAYSSCAGCASKVGAGVLEALLLDMPAVVDPRILVPNSDDAGVVEVNPSTILVQTLDFFTAIVDDPYLFGQIAATNALSDVYAMGGRPLTALNIVCFPTKTLGAEPLGRILRGGADKCQEAGCLLIGGHTVEDSEPKYGLSVTGLVERNAIMRKGGARPGQVLALTKPIGTGILTTAHKREKVDEADLAAAVASMCLLNDRAGAWAVAEGVRSGTDITGFGLLGHSLQMSQASGVTFRLQASSLPLLPNLEKYLAMGCFPGGSSNNMQHFGPMVAWHPEVTEVQKKIIADAQTSGGLLVALDSEAAVARFPQARIIGRVEAAGPFPLAVDP